MTCPVCDTSCAHRACDNGHVEAVNCGDGESYQCSGGVRQVSCCASFVGGGGSGSVRVATASVSGGR